MEDFPSNSIKARRPDAKPPPQPQQKKVERVVQGEVVRRKKSFGRRLTGHFVGPDARSAWAHIAFESLLPAAKDAVLDAVHDALDQMFGGGSGHRRRGRNSGSGSYVSYNRYSQRDRRDEPRTVSRRARATHNFDEIILDTRVEAEEVIDHLFQLVAKFEVATVSDLYDLVGISGDYTDDKWGWENLQGASVIRLNRGNGYLLDLPRPEPLD